jgi:hypothetical protein
LDRLVTGINWTTSSEFGHLGYPEEPDPGRLPFRVRRRENTRRFWVAIYPDGTSENNFTTLAAAKESCETWQPDTSLVALIEEAETHGLPRGETTSVDSARARTAPGPAAVLRELGRSAGGGTTEVVPAAAEPATTILAPPPGDELLPFRSVFQAHLWDTGTPVTRTVRGEALKNIATLAAMRATVEQLLREQIAVARTGVKSNWGGYRYGDEPRTWTEIGSALGVSKQAAAARYGDKDS